jgi:hypothetical protein
MLTSDLAGTDVSWVVAGARVCIVWKHEWWGFESSEKIFILHVAAAMAK